MDGPLLKKVSHSLQIYTITFTQLIVEFRKRGNSILIIASKPKFLVILNLIFTGALSGSMLDLGLLKII